MRKLLFFLAILYGFNVPGQSDLKGRFPLPNKPQLAWHDMEYYLFMHFGPNTFTGKEWGEGTEPEDIFQPSQLDCGQWARIAKESGAKGIIITAKHHDGFCLWPSKFSTHTVRESKWREGKGDVLKELSIACRKEGLKFGVYISPWDRNHPDYGTERYNEVFKGMLKELLTNYGSVWELWWDGANGEGPNGKRQEYDWKGFEQTVRQLSPRTVIFSDIGPDIRWVGNEKGIAGQTNWNYLNTAGFTRGIGAPPVDSLLQGNKNGKHWIPAECDVSIRPGWFYRSSEDEQVKSSNTLFDLYLKSVGRGANLLLNVPPDTRGLIHETDSASLAGFKKLRDTAFADNILRTANTYWEFGEMDFFPDTLTIRTFEKEPGNYGINVQNFVVQLPQAAPINCIILREAVHLGQTIQNFRIVLYNEKNIVKEIRGTTVGRKRILTFPTKTITSFKVYMDDLNKQDNISGIAAYLVPENLIEN